MVDRAHAGRPGLAGGRLERVGDRLGDGDALAGGSRPLVGAVPRRDRRGWRRVRPHRVSLRDLGLDLPVRGSEPERATPPASRPGGSIVVAPLHRGCSLPGRRSRWSPRPISPVAVTPIAGPAPQAGRRPASSRTSSPATTSCTTSTAWAGTAAWSSGRSAGSTATTCCSSTRAATSSTSRPTRSTRCASTWAARRRPFTGSAARTSPRRRPRVRSAVREIAQELVLLYQKRLHAPGIAFSPDTPWQKEIEDAFPYVETPDQRTAIDDGKADMEDRYPMDRLVCGDVGFGKTEVAIRAAFKAIQDGKQVAVLVPTTLLAQQHGNTFADRFAGYPIRVEVLSRFLTRRRRRRSSTASVGRGRLRRSGRTGCCRTTRVQGPGPPRRGRGATLRRDAQGDASRSCQTNVDVLTMSATPIPRTLEMSLVGIRDLSLLQTPPADRQPILTYVGEYDERVAVESIRRELLREGQVFWVHNRVADDRRVRGAAARARAGGAHRRRPRADGRGNARAGRGRLLGGRLRRARLHDDHRERHRHADREHPRRRALRPPRPRPDAPVAGPGRTQRPARVRVPLLPAGPHADRGGLRAAEDDRRGDRPRQRVQDRHARPRDPWRREPPRRRPERPHRRGRLRPLLPDGHRGGVRDEGRGAARRPPR